MRILLVEDDLALGQATRAALMLEGYTVDWLRDGMQASHALNDERLASIITKLSTLYPNVERGALARAAAELSGVM